MMNLNRNLKFDGQIVSVMMNTDPDTCLSVKDLNLWYGKNQALYDISLNVPTGSITALIGPSGCGKSTFIRTLNRMHDLNPDIRITGKVFYGSDDIFDPELDASSLRKEVGMVFQRPNPFMMSIYDNVAYGPKIQGIRRKEELDRIVKEALVDASLWDEVKDRLNKPASGLSGGQQQRLCIARALAVKPKVLLMDEPTSALDPVSTRNVEDLVLSLKGKYTIVIVTHNMQQAARISDYTAFFLNGRLNEFGPTKKIFNNPEDEKTRNYITGKFG